MYTIAGRRSCRVGHTSHAWHSTSSAHAEYTHILTHSKIFLAPIFHVFSREVDDAKTRVLSGYGTLEGWSLWWLYVSETCPSSLSLCWCRERKRNRERARAQEWVGVNTQKKQREWDRASREQKREERRKGTSEKRRDRATAHEESYQAGERKSKRKKRNG